MALRQPRWTGTHQTEKAALQKSLSKANSPLRENFENWVNLIF